jgi:DNA mismatch endonuclease (patch repair protein)
LCRVRPRLRRSNGQAGPRHRRAHCHARRRAVFPLAAGAAAHLRRAARLLWAAMTTAVAPLPAPPAPSSPAVRLVMQGNRRRDTKPEKALRSVLHRRGLRFRVDRKLGSGRSAPRPDVVFVRERIAVFLDGCYWHGCPMHGTQPKTNGAYWSAKIARNRARDTRNTRALTDAGWIVIRVWEHEEPTAAADIVEAAVRRARLS